MDLSVFAWTYQCGQKARHTGPAYPGAHCSIFSVILGEVEGKRPGLFDPAPAESLGTTVAPDGLNRSIACQGDRSKPQKHQNRLQRARKIWAYVG